MQTLPQALRYGLEERLALALPDEHPLAVGGDHVRPVGEHPIEARTARYYVLARGLVEDVYDVVAGSSGDGVLRRGVCEFATEHEVVTVPAHHVVGAEAALNGIVAVPAHQVLGAPEGFREAAAVNQIFTGPAQQGVVAGQGQEYVVAALADEGVCAVGPPQSVRAIGADSGDRKRHP